MKNRSTNPASPTSAYGNGYSSGGFTGRSPQTQNPTGSMAGPSSGYGNGYSSGGFVGRPTSYATGGPGPMNMGMGRFGPSAPTAPTSMPQQPYQSSPGSTGPVAMQSPGYNSGPSIGGFNVNNPTGQGTSMPGSSMGPGMSVMNPGAAMPGGSMNAGTGMGGIGGVLPTPGMSMNPGMQVNPGSGWGVRPGVPGVGSGWGIANPPTSNPGMNLGGGLSSGVGYMPGTSAPPKPQPIGAAYGPALANVLRGGRGFR